MGGALGGACKNSLETGHWAESEMVTLRKQDRKTSFGGGGKCVRGKRHTTYIVVGYGVPPAPFLRPVSFHGEGQSGRQEQVRLLGTRATRDRGSPLVAGPQLQSLGGPTSDAALAPFQPSSG